MLRWLLGVDASEEIAGIDFYFRGGWLLAAGLLALAIAFIWWQYRVDPARGPGGVNNLSRGRRQVLGILQALALLTLVVIALEPTSELRLVKPFRRTLLVLLDSSESMGIADRRSSIEEVAEAARSLGKLPLGGDLTVDRIESVRPDCAAVPRLELAKSALGSAVGGLAKLEESYDLRFFSFGDRLEPERGAEHPAEWLSESEATGQSSRVGTAIDEAVARYAGQPIAGVVCLSDFAWVEGKDPGNVARELGARKIPVHTVSIGLPAPPDIALRRVIAPEVVFKGDRVPLRVELESRGFEGRSAELSLTVDGQRTTSQTLELSGGIQFSELLFLPERDSGTIRLGFEIDELSGETTTANNRLEHSVRVLDEKIKVLYVEGLPRWEYRYLRWVLLRDPRLDVRFLMTKGDPTLAKTSPRHLASFPEEVEDALRFDLIILGDVPAGYFNSRQLELMEKLVKTSGGSLLMVAGPMAAPSSYAGTPIERVLPVKLGTGRWEGVASRVHPVVTPAGRESQVVALTSSNESTDRIWANVRPMFALPNLGGAKPAATVLLSLPKEAEEVRDYPLVAWHRYGTGKSLFVATEDLWRMRLEVGDRYHARFWGQAIQFLTLSRLLGQNRQVSLETDRSSYSSGEPVRVYANVLTESFEPVVETSYPIVLEREGAPDSAVELSLEPVPDAPGLYSGVWLAREDGSHTVRTLAKDAEVSNSASFEVATVPREQREAAARPEVARQVASLSGGQNLALSELGKLAERLGPEEERSTIVRLERSLWDVPLWFVLLVLFAGAEWFLRRRDNLV